MTVMEMIQRAVDSRDCDPSVRDTITTIRDDILIEDLEKEATAETIHRLFHWVDVEMWLWGLAMGWTVDRILEKLGISACY